METKAMNILLQSLPEDHIADFHHLDDAKDIWLAVKARFGGNKESKKMRKSYAQAGSLQDFKILNLRVCTMGFIDRFQKVRCSLNQNCSKTLQNNEDLQHMKFSLELYTFLVQWQHLKNKGCLDFLSFEDLYNKLMSLKIDVKGDLAIDSRVHCIVYTLQHIFISAASTNSKWSTADSKCQPSSVNTIIPFNPLGPTEFN
ncbi:hypothetical protein Tco_0110576 [Tanacetum coccineum]